MPPAGPSARLCLARTLQITVTRSCNADEVRAAGWVLAEQGTLSATGPWPSPGRDSVAQEEMRPCCSHTGMETRPEKSSLQAALLELLAAAARAGIVPAHALKGVGSGLGQRADKGLGCCRSRQTGTQTIEGAPLTIPLGLVLEGVPAG